MLRLHLSLILGSAVQPWGSPPHQDIWIFFKGIQVLSSLAGGRKWERSPENWRHTSGAHAGEKAKGESKVQVSPERA